MKNRKVISLMVAFAVLASMMLAVLPQEEAVAGPPTDAYRALLKNLKGTCKVPYYDGYKTNFYVKGAPKAKKKKIDLSYFRYYVIKDINRDGVNDLLLSRYKSTTGRGKVLVVTYKNHTVVPVFYAKGIREGVFLASDNRFVFKFGNSSEKNCVFMKLDGDKLKLNHVVTYNRIKKSSGKFKYYKGKSSIKKKAYNKALKEVQTELTFTKI